MQCSIRNSQIVKLDEEDDDNGEALRVLDAADIYLSRGFDEDYQFCYTHEELIMHLVNSNL